MRKYILIWLLTISTLSVVGQSAIPYKYWFDGNDHDAISGVMSSNVLSLQLNVNDLSDGIHSFSFQLQDTSGVWCESIARNFYKIGISDTATVASTEYWFDGDVASLKTLNSISGSHIIDVSMLEDGLHYATFAIKGARNEVLDSKTALFYKLSPIEAAVASSIEYWFDGKLENIQLLNGFAGNYVVDASQLESGAHYATFVLRGKNNEVLDMKSSLFYKVGKNDIATASNIEYWFDGNADGKMSISGLTGFYDLDVSSLSKGLHYVTFALIDKENKVLNTQTRFFYKTNGETLISKYQYRLNFSNELSKTVELNVPESPLSIISLLPVETCPIRSSCFEFRIENETPVLYARNDIAFYFYDTDNRMSHFFTQYIDEQIKDTLNVDEIKTITSGVTETMPRPAENEIQWYKFEAEEGDTVAFKCDYATTLQVFSPSGKEIYNASGVDAVKMNGCHTWENGIYYVAIHDVTATRCTTIKLDFMHMDKYDVVDQDVRTVGNGGYNTITIYGNGFDDLYAVELYNSNGDTIQCEEILHKSNNTSLLTFNFENVKLGGYNALFYFATENKDFGELINVESATAINLSTKVSFPESHLRGSYVSYNITITNDGNMTAYYVPLELKLMVDSIEAIADVKFSKFLHPLSVPDEIITDSIDEDLMEDYRAVVSSINDLSQFIIINDTVNGIDYGISHVLMMIPPNSTKELIVSVKMNNMTPVTLNSYMPKEWVPLVNRGEKLRYNLLNKNNNTREWMCCYRERIECIADIAVNIAGNFMPPGAGCATSLALTGLKAAYDVWCSEGSNLEERFRNYLENEAESLKDELIDNAISCVLGWFDGKIDALKEARREAAKAENVDEVLRINKELSELRKVAQSTVRGIYEAAGKLILGGDCIEAFTKKKPNCPPEPDEGGGTSTPVQSFDPNDISGYVAESGSLYIGKQVDKVTYMIEFENDSTFATAPAHTILLADTLDTNVFDVATVTPVKLQIGDKSHDFSTDFKGVATVDMRPEVDAIAQVSMKVDDKGVLTWVLESLDPMTMEPTTQPFNGILPVNDAEGAGMGFVTFSVNLKKGLQDGTEVANKANIIFDANEPISTPYWINETDYVDPVSVIDTLECVSDSVINIKFHGIDERSGIWKYDLYVKPGVESDWFLIEENVTDSSYLYHVYEDITYGFCVVATDKAGNREVKEFYPDFTYLNGEVISGIEAIKVDEVNVNNGILYDLLGRRVENPSPGIYIRNGKKILIK